MTNPLFIFSLDALGYSDEEVYKSAPFFKSMIKDGTWIRKFESIYPTLTYPIHSTIVSGRYPISHGIDNNLKLQPGKEKMDWFWDEDCLKGDSIFKAAKRKGLKVAAFRWPVTGYGDIEYNFPEVWSLEGELLQDHTEKKGSRDFVIEIKERFGEFLDDFSQREKDEYIAKAVAYTFNKYKPDITFVHLVNVDRMKHLYGSKHFGVDDAILDLDSRLQNIFAKIGENYDLYEIDIMLLSDHSQIDTTYGIHLNRLLKDMGLLNTKENGTVSEYKAYFHTCGGSTALYLNEGVDEKIVEEIYKRLVDLNLDGIEKIYKKAEVEKLSASENAYLWVEAKEGYAFEANGNKEIFDRDQFIPYRGNHGFLPTKEGNYAMGIFKGPSFKENVVIEKSELIKVAPTVSKILGLEVENMLYGPIKQCLVNFN